MNAQVKVDEKQLVALLHNDEGWLRIRYNVSQVLSNCLCDRSWWGVIRTNTPCPNKNGLLKRIALIIGATLP